jgi:hypothetical protein
MEVCVLPYYKRRSRYEMTGLSFKFSLHRFKGC